jgi:phospholipid/cholesterol/gamma-HCH transport system substrate-binding protein
VPSLLRRADATLASLQQVASELSQAAERVPQIIGNVEGATENLPGLLTQTQQTVYEIEQLVTQLQGLWFLGGGGEEETAPAETTRLPPTEVRP